MNNKPNKLDKKKNLGQVFTPQSVVNFMLDRIDYQGTNIFNKHILPGEPDPHSLALEEKLNSSLRNWDDFMFAIKTRSGEYKKYQILHAIQDFYLVEIGERVKHKKYALMHFTKNKKENDSNLINFCFNLEEQAKSKLKNCVLREKKVLIPKWIRMLKKQMLYFTDYRSRDWLLEQIKSHGNR